MKRFIVSYNDALGACQMDFAWNEKRAWRYFNKITQNPRRPITIAEIAVQYEEDDDCYEVLAKYEDGRLIAIREDQEERLNDVPDDKHHSEEYLATITDNSEEWKRLKARRFDLDHHRCIFCGATENLKLHHIYYGDDLLDMKSVVTICDPCHSAVHGKTIPKGEQYDPCTPEALHRFIDYVNYTNKLIDDMKGETEYE